MYDSHNDKDDFRKIIYGVIVGFILVVVGFVSFNTLASCGYSLNNCLGAAPQVDRTPIPTLVPGTLPAPVQFKWTAVAFTANPASSVETPSASAETDATPFPTEMETHVASGSVESGPDIARPSNPGGPGLAVDMSGNVDNGKQIFVDRCQVCHGVEGKGGNPNPGSNDGTIPSLNPIDPSMVSADYKTFAANIDLFIEHGSTPGGLYPVYTMPAWGDSDTLKAQDIADVIAYIISLNK